MNYKPLSIWLNSSFNMVIYLCDFHKGSANPNCEENVWIVQVVLSLLLLGSFIFGHLTTNLVGTVSSFMSLGLQCVNDILCWVCCCKQPCNVLCTFRHFLLRFFHSWGAAYPLCQAPGCLLRHLLMTCPGMHALRTRHDLPTDPVFLRVMLLALSAKRMDALLWDTLALFRGAPPVPGMLSTPLISPATP